MSASIQVCKQIDRLKAHLEQLKDMLPETAVFDVVGVKPTNPEQKTCYIMLRVNMVGVPIPFDVTNTKAGPVVGCGEGRFLVEPADPSDPSDASA